MRARPSLVESEYSRRKSSIPPRPPVLARIAAIRPLARASLRRSRRPLAVDHALDHQPRPLRSLIDRQLHVLADAGEILLFLDRGEDVAVFFEGELVEPGDVGIDLGVADRIVA